MSEEIMWLDPEFEELERPVKKQPADLQKPAGGKVPGMMAVTVLAVVLSLIGGWIGGYIAVRIG